MDKIVKTILLIIGISVSFLWVSNSFMACKSDKDQTEDMSGIEDGEELFEGDAIDYTTSDVNDEPLNEEIVDEYPVEEEGPSDIDFTAPPTVSTPEVKKSTPVSKVSSSSEGDYMVITGNYLLKSNAEIMTVKLKDLGYANADIAIFDNSQYHTVIADRYNTYQKAAETVGALKRQGVECYVKKKQ